MSLSLKAIGVLAGAVVTATVAAVETLPPPDSFWPNSAVGWFSAVTSGITIVVAVVAVFRWYRAPLKTAIAEAEARLAKASTEMEKRLTHDIDASAREQAQEHSRFRESVTAQMNGSSDRIDRADKTARLAARRSGRLLRMMVVSQEDRKHLREGLDEIKATLKGMRERQDHP